MFFKEESNSKDRSYLIMDFYNRIIRIALERCLFSNYFPIFPVLC